MAPVQAAPSRMSIDAVFVEVANTTADAENKDKELRRTEVKANNQRAKSERVNLKALEEEAYEAKKDAENSGGFFNFLGRALLGALTLGVSIAAEAAICAASGKKFDMTKGGVFSTIGQVFAAIFTLGLSFIGRNVWAAHKNGEHAEAQADVDESKLAIERFRRQMSQSLDDMKVSEDRSSSVYSTANQALQNSVEQARRISRRAAGSDE